MTKAILAKPNRRLLTTALAVLALAAAACGGGSSKSSAPSHSTHSTSSSGIPQGPNAGDKDADNNGGPSDGDGNK